MNKYLVVIAILFLLSIQASTSAQETYVEANAVTVTCNQTTHLIFPFAIRSIDRGSQDVLAQKAPGSDNVLQLKAAKAGFTETNITVITADNKLYPFKVNYALSPQHLTISFASAKGNSNSKDEFFYSIETDINKNQSNVASLQNTIRQVVLEKKRMYALKDHHGMVHLLLKGIYIKEDVFYFQFQISNLSNIRFDIQNMAFIIKHSGKIKRKATQENVLQPLLTSKMDSAIQSHSSQMWVVALPKFTLEDGKLLSIQVYEENGGRNLALKVYNRHLLVAKVL